MTGKNSLARYEFIDSLRGLAFLGVLAFHVGGYVAGLPGRLSRVVGQGHEGVMLFFLCSAMTLFLSLSSRRKEERRPVANYFIRRVFRIAPLFFAGALFYPAFHAFVGRPDDLSPWCVLSTLTFTNAWSVPWINRMVPGGWSIAVEMNFYLLVPLLFRVITTAERAIWAAFVTLIVGASASAAAPILLTRALGAPVDFGPFFWYWLPAQMPIFCLGFALFFVIRPALRDRAEGRPAPKGRANLLLLIAGYLSIAVCFSDPALYLGHALFGVAFLLLAWSMALSPNPLLVNPITRAIGVVSFSAYLTHFAALDLVERGLGSLPPMAPLPRFLALLAGSLALTLAASALTYRFIEVPGQKLGRSIIRRLESTDPVGKAEPAPAVA